MTLFWHPTGLRIRYANGVLRMDDLNPDSAMAWRMSRWEMIKLGLNCIRATLQLGLENGETRMRKRGARVDVDCIDEICEIVAQGVLATAAVKYVGVPWATWQSWLKKNHEQAREKFNFAYDCHLEVIDAVRSSFTQISSICDSVLKVNQTRCQQALVQRNVRRSLRGYHVMHSRVSRPMLSPLPPNAERSLSCLQV